MHIYSAELAPPTPAPFGGGHRSRVAHARPRLTRLPARLPARLRLTCACPPARLRACVRVCVRACLRAWAHAWAHRLARATITSRAHGCGLPLL